MNRTNRFFLTVCATLLCGGIAAADVVPDPSYRLQKPIRPVPTASNRDAVALARRDPEISKMIVAARGGLSAATGPSSPTETAVQVQLGGQCGFAGCSSTTLVAFSFRSSGANPATQTVLALVTCPPVGSAVCTVAPAEVRAQGGSGSSTK